MRDRKYIYTHILLLIYIEELFRANKGKLPTIFHNSSSPGYARSSDTLVGYLAPRCVRSGDCVHFSFFHDTAPFTGPPRVHKRGGIACRSRMEEGVGAAGGKKEWWLCSIVLGSRVSRRDAPLRADARGERVREEDEDEEK